VVRRTPTGDLEGLGKLEVVERARWTNLGRGLGRQSLDGAKLTLDPPDEHVRSVLALPRADQLPTPGAVDRGPGFVVVEHSHADSVAAGDHDVGGIDSGACGASAFLCDSEEYWDDADPDDAACPCGGEVLEIGVAFSLRDDGDVRWITVGGRCVACGVLGVYTDWKIDYSPTGHLFAAV
jgi:hypothetical protein